MIVYCVFQDYGSDCLSFVGHLDSIYLSEDNAQKRVKEIKSTKERFICARYEKRYTQDDI